MSKIHQPTGLEEAVHSWLREQKIQFNPYPKVEGNPDTELILPDGSRHYLFIDGCFWHCCPLHYRRPKSRAEYWIRHVEEANRRREERRRGLPYPWTRIWEHDVKSGRFREVIHRVLSE